MIWIFLVCCDIIRVSKKYIRTVKCNMAHKEKQILINILNECMTIP